MGGGEANSAVGFGSFIASGDRDTAEDNYSFASGGFGNRASGGAFMVGGDRNHADGSFVVGGTLQTVGPGCAYIFGAVFPDPCP